MSKKNLKLSKKFKALGDENRLKILCVIFAKKKICVSEIAKELKISVAIVSHHLKALEKVGIVSPLRTGKNVCYLLLKNSFASDLRRLVCKYK